MTELADKNIIFLGVQNHRIYLKRTILRFTGFLFCRRDHTVHLMCDIFPQSPGFEFKSVNVLFNSVISICFKFFLVLC